MKDANCVFCMIADGTIPSAKVYEDEDFIAILDISPAHKGHVLLIPKEHYANVFELPEELAAKAMRIAKMLAVKVKKATNADGINLLQNNGEAAGQSVAHFHMHIIPRTLGDGAVPVWNPLSYEPGEAEKMAEKIRG